MFMIELFRQKRSRWQNSGWCEKYKTSPLYGQWITWIWMIVWKWIDILKYTFFFYIIILKWEQIFLNTRSIQNDEITIN